MGWGVCLEGVVVCFVLTSFPISTEKFLNSWTDVTWFLYCMSERVEKERSQSATMSKGKSVCIHCHTCNNEQLHPAWFLPWLFCLSLTFTHV